VTIPPCELAPGLTISRVVTGLWQIADMEREGRTFDLDRAARAMAPYVRAGLTSFDMADHYGSAEEVAGRFRAAYADDGRDVQFLTKWVPEPGEITRQAARAAVERALRRLGVERIELLQFHTWRYSDPSWLDALWYLQELQDDGLVLHLGLTNVDSAHLRLALESGVRVVSNQVAFSLLDRRAASEMSEVCRRYGVKLLAYGTLAGGLLSERWLGRDDPGEDGLATWSQLKYRRFVEAAGGWEAYQQLLRTAAGIANKHGVSLANVASRYVLEQPAVGAIIIGARLGEREHIEETKRLFAFELDEDDRARLEEAFAALKPLPGDCGDEYRKPPYLTASGDLSHHLERFPPPFEVRETPDGRRRVLSGTRWEALAGYCRAVRVGERIWVSGTTATHRDRVVGGNDAASQTHFAIDKLEGALQSLGARLEDVVRTRLFVQRLEDWEAVARAHGARFGHILPANTLVQAPLVGEEHLVEIEAEAVVTDV
jgi:aryl-alcohol dehydrogenase-like predicted oxidoreductase/enamine deaminase RidA (YjgF/YER057c/UK114 family)